MIKIKSIEVYKFNLPLKEGKYNWSHQSSVSVFDSTIVKINTNKDTFGFGETCTLGPAYLPAYPEGVREGIKKIGNSLIGIDPTNFTEVNFQMDRNLKGHNYVKSAIDMACWDIIGKNYKMTLWKLLGGKFGEQIDLYRAISQVISEIMKQ